MITVQQAWQQASKQIDRFEAKLLLAYCLGVNRTYLITHDRDEINERTLEKYRHCVNERSKGVPVAYITGLQEFYSRPFKVNPNVLIPRPDTETLVEFILDQCPNNQPLSLLDLGTGSGCIAITLALENPHLLVSATDISENALKTARENAQILNARVSFYLGSWFDALPEASLFDIIVSNPPYIHRDDQHLQNLSFEPIEALTDGADGLSDIGAIIDRAPKFLKPQGILAFEHGWNQAESVRHLFEKSHLWQSIKTIRDLGGNDRVTAARLT